MPAVCQKGQALSHRRGALARIIKFTSPTRRRRSDGHLRRCIREEDRGDLISAYHKIFNSDDKNKKLEAAIAWSRWEGSTSSLAYKPEMADSFSDPKFALAFALIENHYFVNKGFLEHENQLIESGIDIIRSIPTIIVQGRYDIVCPMTTAWELSQNWPEAKLVVAPSSGHTAFEKEITHELIKATDLFGLNV